ncbi:MAG: putative membrane protein YdjX (TVP38/TMEM64 family) [Myxococcota bacterium]|jgi:uncharacterized membrane protein YdjX (TVP38/TMEM64 family)
MASRSARLKASDQVTETFTKYWRWGLVALLALGLLGLNAAFGLTDLLSIEVLKTAMADAGPLGAVVFVGVFAVGNLLSVPGLVFIIASMLAYGKVTGTAVALVGSLAALTLNFWTVRLVGGAPKSTPTGRAARLLARLSERPVGTVFVLRNFMMLSPPLNYALALSTIRYRDYMVGSALGLLAPIGLYAVFLDQLISYGIL